jgi:hypothetical protein
MKKCSKCGIEKPLSEFHTRKRSKDGHRSACRVCESKKNALYRKQNREKLLKKKALYREQNKEKIAEYQTLYREQNKEKIAKINALYYEQNKEKIAEYKALYREQNKEKIAKINALYYEQRKVQEPSCVYQISNKQNGKIYIGETLRGELRWKGHLCSLRGGYHDNKKLQGDFDKYGEEAFEWEIIKELPEDKSVLLLEEAREISKRIKEGQDLYNLSLTNEQLQLLQEHGG